ncbi:hypothetical protein LTR66_001152, partial [Elasticomyces elasticus]
IREGDGIERWAVKLKAKFKLAASKAWTRLLNEEYTMNSVRAGRAPADYVMNTVRWAREADVSNVEGQLTHAWLRLAPEFQNVIHKPNLNTTIDGFIEEMDAHTEA